MNNNYPAVSQNKNTSTDEYYIVFSLRNKQYAINIMNVTEVINFPSIEAHETMPEGITGIFNYKGMMIKAVDLCPLLGFEPNQFSINNKLIIINTSDSCFAVFTDSITDIFPFNGSFIQPVPYAAQNSILKDIYKNETDTICIININNLNNILLSNTKKQNLVNYSELFPADKKSKEILTLRSNQALKRKNTYSFNFNLSTENQYILFTLNDNYFYIELKYIKEFSTTRRYKITKLPYTPEYIRGLINLKGEFLIVIDLKLFLGLGESVCAKSSKLIIVEKNEFNIALMVDDIKYIQNLNNITQSIFNNISKYVYAEFTENNTLYTVLNIEKIINDERIYINID